LKYYDGSEKQEKYCKDQLEKIFKTIQLVNEERFFYYEKKEAKYDPKTGRIDLIDIDMRRKKSIIKTFDDAEKEKSKLHKELKLTTDDVMNSSVDELAEGYQKLIEHTAEGYEIEKSDFYAQSVDQMRID